MLCLAWAAYPPSCVSAALLGPGFLFFFSIQIASDLGFFMKISDNI